MNIHIRPAVPEDLKVLVAMRQERISWLAERGSDQWQVGLTVDGFADRVAASIAANQTYVAVDENHEVIGTIAVDKWTNPDLWSETELAESVIVHRMITWPRATNSGIGAVLLKHANKIALNLGCPWVRLDAWTNNTDLHAYYQRAGFRHVRTVDGHKSKSTALFERQAGVSMTTIRKQPADLGGERGVVGPGSYPSICELQDLVVEYSSGQGEGTALQVTPGASWRLWADNRSWFAAAAGTGLSKTARILEGEPLSWLNPSHVYRIAPGSEGQNAVITLDSAYPTQTVA